MKFFRNLLIAWLVSVPAWADDTDIYLDADLGGGVVGPPLVMMSLDLRSNLGSSKCSNVLAACSGGTCACETQLSEEIFEALDLVDASGSAGADGVSDFAQHSEADLGVDGLVSGSEHWSGLNVTMFDSMRAVFQLLFAEIQDVRVGMMVNHDDSCTGNPDAGPTEIPAGGAAGCSNGAYVLKGFFDPTDATERLDMTTKLAALPVPSTTVNGTTWNGHPYQLREMYFEYYRYITGQDLFNAMLGYDSYNSTQSRKNLGDGGNDVDANLAPDASVYTGAGATASYSSPFASGTAADWACSKLYMVNTLDAVSNSTADSDFAISAAAPAGLGIASPTDETVIAKLNDLDLASATLGINIDGDQTLTSYWVADNVNITTNDYATAGGTGTAYSHGEPDEALDGLRSIFREILSVSTTFVAASVPVNVFNRAEVVDNVYLAVFEAQEKPRWPGNVKKLKIAELTTVDGGGNTVVSHVIQDADDDNAFSSDDGRIKSDALTYWTDVTGPDVIGFDPDLGEVTGKDGRSVQRGGAGQQIPGMLSDTAPGAANSVPGARQLFTENPASANTLLAFNADAATATALAPYLDPDSVLNGPQRQAVIGWGRGIDVFDEDADNSDESRDWMMGDPMHSRPLVVNYGATSGYTKDDPQIRLFFGTNNGWFHIVENTNADASESGEEVFAFMPLEVMKHQPKLINNSATVIEPHPYGVDGEAVAYTSDADADGTIESGDDVWVFTGLRRGGKAYYAFDASDPTANPTMKWKITNTGDFAELGMSFSTPRVVKVKYDGTVIPALIFAGGYHGGWSGAARVGKDLDWGDSSEGNAVYVVNADTGALIWKAVDGTSANTNTVHYNAALDDAIPSTVATLDSDGNGITDRVYVGDTGGALWRLDLPEGGSASHRRLNWKISKLAQFGSDTASGDRRFFHAPDLVKTRDSVGNYHGIIISSGNRANPRETSVDNYVYLIKDRLTTTGASVTQVVDETDGSTANDLVDITDLCISGEEAGCAAADLSLGWKLSLESSGEKGLAAPLTSDGIVFFTSYLPEGTSSSSN
jgi:type IV pilus assembly protein PilY1